MPDSSLFTGLALGVGAMALVAAAVAALAWGLAFASRYLQFLGTIGLHGGMGDNSYDVSGRRIRRTDWVVQNERFTYTCRCGSKAVPIRVDTLVEHAFHQHPNQVFDDSLNARLDAVCKSGYDLRRSKCARAVRICYSPFEAPPWSSRYKVSVFLIIEVNSP